MEVVYYCCVVGVHVLHSRKGVKKKKNSLLISLISDSSAVCVLNRFLAHGSGAWKKISPPLHIFAVSLISWSLHYRADDLNQV